MSVFVIPKKLPVTLNRYEHIIPDFSFVDEIKAVSVKRPRGGIMTVNYFRELVAAVGAKYIGIDYDALTSVNASKFVGVPCTTEAETNQVLIKVFSTQYPEMLYKYVEYHFNHRPSGTNLIFFGPPSFYATRLAELGCQQVMEKDLDKMVTAKTKKMPIAAEEAST